MAEKALKSSTSNLFSWKSGDVRQIIFALIVAASKLECGLVIGWPAVLPKIQDDNSTRLVLSAQDVTWLVSMPGLTGVASSLIAGPLMEAVGPRRLLLGILLPAALLWLLQAFSAHIRLVYLGRVLSSLVYSLLVPLPSVLLAELVDSRLRGIMLSLEFNFALGQMTAYLMAYFLPWDLATALCSAPVVLAFLLTLLVPESPYWLCRQNQKDKALKSLKNLRGPSENVSLELDEISSKMQERKQTTVEDQVAQLADPQHYRPILLLTAVFVLRELGGQYVIFSYSVYLFKRAGAALDAFACTLLLGAVRLVFTGMAFVCVDRVGRRPLMIGTSLVGGVAEAVGAVFLLVDIPGSSWMPMTAVMVFVSAYGLGIGPIPWALMGEMLPTPVRALGSAICSFWFSVAVFGMSFAFPFLLDSVGLGLMLLLFALAHVVMALIIWAFMPETRGRSLTDLQDSFKPTTGNDMRE
ncbi:facilitated trehalose transporter Tret1-like isoform X2 [Penaeus japonicus]|uniref:facilitated trehalose transporter Tret1-like isoform X2 n=1 Tax=Penaeus japonicus TaxID=27405 RepID=UPI001C70C32C|nr:facilitated trehalose transporter Tret1-like isoform X2 [Penaeus japonicus]